MSSGRIKQVIGAVVDVEFPADSIPAIYNALTTGGDGAKIVLEVQQQLGGGVVRTVAMTSTEGLKRGDEVVDTQSPIKVPVGGATLGRIFNVTGDPIDQKGPVAASERLPIHRKARRSWSRARARKFWKPASSPSTSSARSSKAARWGRSGARASGRPS